jgi:hypothetical protein
MESDYNMCVDDAGGSTKPGTKVQIYACDDVAASQNWTLASDGRLTINGRCADVIGQGTAPGTKVQLWSCTFGANQQWQAEADGELVNPVSGDCLDDPGGSAVNGTQLVIEQCSATAGQIWLPSYVVPGGTGDIVSQLRQTSPPPLCVDDTNGSPQNGTAIRSYPCAGSNTSEDWRVEPGEDIRFESDESTCLDIKDNGTVVGSTIQLYTCNGDSSQFWITLSDGALYNPGANLCLEDPQSGAGDPALDIDTCPGSADVPGVQWFLPAP